MNSLKNLTKNNDADACQNMVEVRHEVDRLDIAIVQLLAERQSYMEAAARIKQSRSLVHDEARIEDVVAKVKESAQILGLSHDIIEPVYRLLIDRCIAHEFKKFDSLKD